MALIKCSECGERVSTKAHTCPHCGKPMTIAIGSIILGVAITLLLTFLLMLCATISPVAVGIVVSFIVLLFVVMGIIFFAKRI